MKQVLVTGGSGRLGRYVVRELRQEFDVTVMDRIAPADDIAYVCGDILDRSAIAHALHNQDAVVHLAALDADVTASDTEFVEVNVQGTWNVFDLARAAGVGKIVHCSSVAAVNISHKNPPRYLPIDVDHLTDPTTAYGLSKLMGEKIARRFATLGGMDIICLRPTLVMQPDIVYAIARTTAQADATPPPPPASHSSWKSIGEVISGSRAFIDPRDAATAFKAALQTDRHWGIFNVSSADSYSALATLAVVERELGVRPILRDAALYANESRASIYGISETTKSLGWTPVHGWSSVFNEVLDEAQPER